MTEAGEKSGMRFDIGSEIKGWMQEAGFINVTEVIIPWPIGTWPKDRHQREIGHVNQIRLEQGILDFCSRRFANKLGVCFYSPLPLRTFEQLLMANMYQWSSEEIDVFGAMMRSAVKNNKLLAHQWS